MTMNNNDPDRNIEETQPEVISAEAPVPSSPFVSSAREKLCAALMYPAAYFYVLFCDCGSRWYLPVTAVLLAGITELLHRDRKPAPESFVWLGCLACTVAGSCLQRNGVWETGEQNLFVHIFFVWWVLSRSGALLEGKSGHFLPMDALNGFIILPFGSFFLRIRTVADAVRQFLAPKEKAAKARWLWAAGAAAVCLGLFLGAARLLLAADAGFQALLAPLEALFHFDWDCDVWLRLGLSLPVGAWLYGLIGGAYRKPRAFYDRQRDRLEDALCRLQKVPAGFWTAVIGGFSLLYLAFFVVQGRYLFGAFTRTLPEGFIVSEYARQGFFELCKVMAVNFALLWVVTRMASPEAAGKRSFKTCCALLLAESMVFAVIALSKLGLYISCFGLTQLRLQSTWLVCVLFAGCALWMYHLLTGRPAMRKWMIFGAVTLSVLCLL